MKKIYKKYQLLQDLPTKKAGRCIYFQNEDEKYYFKLLNKEFYNDTIDPEEESLYIDRKSESYSLEEVKNNKKFFKPIGELFDLIPKFPSFSDFFDNSDGHFYIGETRHNGLCHFCCKLKKIITSNEYEKSCYELLKKLYSQKFNSDQ